MERKRKGKRGERREARETPDGATQAWIQLYLKSIPWASQLPTEIFSILNDFKCKLYSKKPDLCDLEMLFLRNGSRIEANFARKKGDLMGKFVEQENSF